MVIQEGGEDRYNIIYDNFIAILIFEKFKTFYSVFMILSNKEHINKILKDIYRILSQDYEII